MTGRAVGNTGQLNYLLWHLHSCKPQILGRAVHFKLWHLEGHLAAALNPPQAPQPPNTQQRMSLTSSKKCV